MRSIYIPTVALFLAVTSYANAGITMTVQPLGSDVVVTWSGSLLVGTPVESDTQSADFLQIIPLGGTLETPGAWDRYKTSGGPPFGSGIPTFFEPVSAPTDPLIPKYSFSGDLLGLRVIISPTTGAVLLPAGYSSGDPLSGSITYFGQSLDSLGISPGIYSWAVDDANADTITMDVVPEPSSWLLCALGLAGIGVGAVARSRRRKLAGGDVADESTCPA